MTGGKPVGCRSCAVRVNHTRGRQAVKPPAASIDSASGGLLVSRSLMRSADAVVIGGGTNGTSAAYHLATLGVRNVLLLERRHLAAGATGKSGSLIRMHYTNEPESRLAFESLKVFQNFGSIVGGECGFEEVGFVQIVPPGYEAARDPGSADALLLTVPDVAARLSVPRAYVYALARRADLPAVRIGRYIRIPDAALREWQEAKLKRSLDRRSVGSIPSAHDTRRSTTDPAKAGAHPVAIRIAARGLRPHGETMGGGRTGSARPRRAAHQDPGQPAGSSSDA